MAVYIFIGIYVILIIGISYFYSRNGSDEDYLISGRNRNQWNILASKFAGAVGVSTFITYTSYTYKFGPWGKSHFPCGMPITIYHQMYYAHD